MKKLIVVEIVKSWDDGTNPNLTLISTLFQAEIRVQLANGNCLNSWQFCQYSRNDFVLETIIAVFESKGVEV